MRTVHHAHADSTQSGVAVLRSSAYVALSRVTFAATRLAILVLLAARWGSEAQGAYAVAVATTTISALLVSSGAEIANGYYAATLGIKRALLVHSLAFGTVLGTAAGIVLYILAPHVPFLSALGHEYRVLLPVSVAPMILQFVFVGLLVGPGMFKSIFLSTLAGAATHGLIAAVVLATSSSPAFIFLGFTVGNALVFALAFAAAWSKADGQIFNASLARDTAKYSTRAYPLNVLNWGAFRIDLLLVAWFRSTAEAGIYALASSLAEGLLYIAKSIAPAMFSARAMGQSQSSGEISPMYRIVAAFTLLAGVVIVASFGLLVLPLLSAEYVLAVPVLAVLCVAMLPMTLHTMASWELAGSGRPHLALPGALSAVAVTICLAPPAILILGILGAAAVSVLAYTTASMATLRAVAPNVAGAAILISLRPRGSDLRRVLNAISLRVPTTSAPRGADVDPNGTSRQ